MEFSYTTLGSTSAKPVVDKFPSAHVVNIRGRLFLVDCGEGTQMQLCRYGFSLLKIDNVMISHLHGDHVFGIFGLISSMGLCGRTGDLFVYAPRDFGPMLRFFMAHFGDGVKFNIIHKVLNCKEPETIFDSRNVYVQAFPLNHHIDTFGFVFREKEPELNVKKWKVEAEKLSLHEIALLKSGNNAVRDDGTVLSVEEYTYIPYKGRSFAYCSDTAPFDKLAEWVSGVDLLYHEATYGDAYERLAGERYHSTASQAAKVALESGAKMLVIGHFSSRYKTPDLLVEEASALFSNTVAAVEGKTVNITLDKIDE